MKRTIPSRSCKQRVGLAAALALFALPADAATIVFNATGDNTIINGVLANDNYGNFNPISSGKINDAIPNQSALVRFDVSALDGLYSSIDSITLRFHYVNDASAGAGNAVVTTNLHAITAANRGWIAGTHAGAAATGESTWNNLARNTTTWAGSAGLGTAGTDYDSTVLATHTLNSTRPAAGSVIDLTFAGDTVALTDLIDAWMVDNVDLSRANPGLLLRTPTPPAQNARNRLTVSSMEDPNTALRPQLIVNYTVVPEPSSALVGCLGLLALLRRRRN
jgi:hypothetical protein